MNRQRSLLIALIFLLVPPTHVRAQAWSGILDPTRAIDWSTAGAGAIPPRATICSALGTAGQAASFVQSVSMAQINSALSSCTSGQTVLLNPGTYNTAGGTIQIPSNVTLRGSGPTKTIINETGTVTGTPPVIQFGTHSVSFPYGNEPNPSVSTAITGGTSQGSTSITVASASGITVGTLLTLSQADASFMTDVGTGGTCSWCSGGEVGLSGQTVQVTAVNGNTIKISDPLYVAYTRSSPTAYPFTATATAAGLENLKISASGSQVVNTSGNGYNNINMIGVINSWVKNVESDFTEGSHMWLNFGLHNTIRDSFFHDAFAHAAGATDGELRIAYKSSANLIENNIFWRQHASLVMDYGSSGNVVAYNYSSGTYNDGASTWLIEDFAHHGANPMMNLYEGNITAHWQMEQTWGASNFETVFRSYSTGTNLNVPPSSARGALQTASGTRETQNAYAFEISSAAQYTNMVAVIDGSDYSVNTTHAASRLVYPASANSSTPACIQVGYNDDDSTGNSPNLTDSTMLYQGVLDCNAGTFQWQNGVQTLPASFYLSGKPSWWGSVAWPPIGPDVTNGDFSDWVNSTAATTRGYVNKIPALNCFDDSTSNGTTNLTAFDANTCYTSSGTSVPAPPTALGAVVN